MATAVQGNFLGDILKTPGFFTAAIAADVAENPFDRSFKSHVDPDAFKEPYNDPQPQDALRDVNTQNDNLFLQSIHGDAFNDMFSYSRQPQYPNPLHHPQVPSPPSSAKQSPPNWPYGEYQPHHSGKPMLSDLSTEQNPRRPRIEFGQVTPPDDQLPSNLDYQQIQPGHHTHPVESSDLPHVTASGKRKRSSNASGEIGKSPKRARKSSTRAKLSAPAANQPETLTQEDHKRSKFLERNRVAASKCRQKKKEWTSNLEVRARELQASKNELAMMVSSLKGEVIWLKGEMLKHTGCGCDQIREYLCHSAENITKNNSAMFKQFESAASPVGTAPNSRSGSIDGTLQHFRSRQSSLNFDEDSGSGRDAPGSPAMHFKSEHELEALLTSQLVHDTSNLGIAKIMSNNGGSER
ncbi:hypothetical protein MMC19_001602 [Ptychographa xylographoides]|nr:hypothetical protein [Ptychographa xylographoides]